MGTSRAGDIDILVDCPDRPAGEVQDFCFRLQAFSGTLRELTHGLSPAREHEALEATCGIEGFTDVLISGLLAAVALQHVHRIDGHVVTADSVLVHLRLLDTSSNGDWVRHYITGITLLSLPNILCFPGVSGIASFGMKNLSRRTASKPTCLGFDFRIGAPTVAEGLSADTCGVLPGVGERTNPKWDTSIESP